ncbi:MAG TPA: PKD domain-containing protein, partial [Candidatus Kapabacteria bacterium]|nr:PKD domain-containing protein [Candidatus Kapabacteria bacterium]
MKQRIFNTVVFAVIGSVVALAALIPSIANAQSVTIGTIPSASFCSGDPISVSFTATGYWQHRNAFTLQLSDPSGSFTSGFTNLGSLKDTLPGTFTISDTIPGNLAGSTHYRFRIMAALPYMTSADNGSDIAIGHTPNLSIGISPPVTGVGNNISAACEPNDSESLSVDTFYWNFGDGATTPTESGVGLWAADSIHSKLSYTTIGTKTITVRVVTPEGCSTTKTATIQVLDCTSPVIPHDAHVIDSDQEVLYDTAAIWVNPGLTVTVLGIDDTVFAESGSTITASYGSRNEFYLKAGAILNGSTEAIAIYATGASPGDATYKFLCPSLDFDYTNAPPNAIMPAGVNVASVPVAVRISPN